MNEPVPNDNVLPAERDAVDWEALVARVNAASDETRRRVHEILAEPDGFEQSWAAYQLRRAQNPDPKFGLRVRRTLLPTWLALPAEPDDDADDTDDTDAA